MYTGTEAGRQADLLWSWYMERLEAEPDAALPCYAYTDADRARITDAFLADLLVPADAATWLDDFDATPDDASGATSGSSWSGGSRPARSTTRCRAGAPTTFLDGGANATRVVLAGDLSLARSAGAASLITPNLERVNASIERCLTDADAGGERP